MFCNDFNDSFDIGMGDSVTMQSLGFECLTDSMGSITSLVDASISDAVHCDGFDQALMNPASTIDDVMDNHLFAFNPFG